MSILNSIKKGVKNSGSNKGKILYFGEGNKRRIRFLHEIEDGIEIGRHDAFDDGVDFFDQEPITGEAHPLEEDEGVRHRTTYVYSVWDYDAKEVKLFVGYANNFSPLPALVGMYESYGTLMDRDYVITQNGKQLQMSFTVVPMDKVKFKNAKAKPYSKKKTLEILDKAFPAPATEEEEEKPKKKKPKKNEKPTKNRKPEVEDDDDDEDEIESEYEGMSAKELYKECVERDLDVKKKQKPAYYIAILEEDDESEHDDEDEDEWDDEDDDDEEGDW